MNVSCSKCATRYTVPDAKVRGRKVRLPCRHCGTPIIIDGREAAPAQGPPSIPKATSAGPPTSEWSVSIDGAAQSMTVDAIAAGFKSGRITSDTHVWRRGMSGWILLSAADDLTRELTRRGVQLSGGLADALGDDEDEATRMVDLSSHPMPGPGPEAPLADRKTPAAGMPPAPAALSAAIPDDDEDEATAMFSAATHGKHPAAAMSEALPDDEDEATAMFSAATHGKHPTAAMSEALPDDEDEATAMFSAATHGKHPTAAMSEALPDDEDEATKMYSAEDHGADTDLSAALPDDDDGEATKMYSTEDHQRVEGTKPGVRKPPALPTKGAKRAKAAPTEGSRKPTSRAESAAPTPPPSAAAKATDEWEESSVIVAADAPEDNRLAVSAAKFEPADERTDRTQAAKRRSELPVATILLLIALALAAGAAGFLISQRTQPPAQAVTNAPPDPDPGGTAAHATPPEPTAEPAPGEAPEQDGEDTEDEGADEERAESGDEPERAARTPVKRARRAAPQPAPEPEAEPAPPPSSSAATPSAAASAPPPPPSEPEPPGPLDTDAARGAIAGAADGAQERCSKPGEPNGSAVVSLTLVPTGNAVGVSLKGPLSGTSTGLCIMQSFMKVRVEPFTGQATRFTRTVRIR